MLKCFLTLGVGSRFLPVATCQMLLQDKYGCRVVQKMMEALPQQLKMDIASEIMDNVIECIEDMNGNHVIQKVVENLDEAA